MVTASSLIIIKVFYLQDSSVKEYSIGTCFTDTVNGKQMTCRTHESKFTINVISVVDNICCHCWALNRRFAK
jgi:hypothetical protein